MMRAILTVLKAAICVAAAMLLTGGAMVAGCLLLRWLGWVWLGEFGALDRFLTSLGWPFDDGPRTPDKWDPMARQVLIGAVTVILWVAVAVGSWVLRKRFDRRMDDAARWVRLRAFRRSVRESQVCGSGNEVAPGERR